MIMYSGNWWLIVLTLMTIQSSHLQGAPAGQLLLGNGDERLWSTRDVLIIAGTASATIGLAVGYGSLCWHRIVRGNNRDRMRTMRGKCDGLESESKQFYTLLDDHEELSKVNAELAQSTENKEKAENKARELEDRIRDLQSEHDKALKALRRGQVTERAKLHIQLAHMTASHAVLAQSKEDAENTVNGLEKRIRDLESERDEVTEALRREQAVVDSLAVAAEPLMPRINVLNEKNRMKAQPPRAMADSSCQTESTNAVPNWDFFSAPLLKKQRSASLGVIDGMLLDDFSPLLQQSPRQPIDHDSFHTASDDGESDAENTSQKSTEVPENTHTAEPTVQVRLPLDTGYPWKAADIKALYAKRFGLSDEHSVTLWRGVDGTKVKNNEWLQPGKNNYVTIIFKPRNGRDAEEIAKLGKLLDGE